MCEEHIVVLSVRAAFVLVMVRYVDNWVESQVDKILGVKP